MSETEDAIRGIAVIRHKEIYGFSDLNGISGLRILRVRIICATGLVRKDLLSSNDYYCKILLYRRNQSSSTVCGAVKTKTKKNTLTPIWNEEFLFRVNPNENKVVIELYNEMRMRHDGLRGLVSINLAELDICTESSDTHLQPKRLKICPTKNNSNVQGNLIVYVVYASDIANPISVIPRERRNIDNVPESMDISNHSDEASSFDRLPMGWEERVDQNGRTYYVDNINKRTQWEKPSHNGLPPGWGQRIDDTGRVYYVNHRTRKGQWEFPRSSSTMPESVVPTPKQHYKSRQKMSSIATTEVLAPDSVQSSSEVDAATMFQRRRQISHEDMLFYRNRQKKCKHTPRATSSRSRAVTSHPASSSGITQSDITTVLEDEILPGWQIATAPNGQHYFINHNNQTTTWDDPRTARHRSRSTSGLPVSVPSIIRTSSRDDLLANLGPLPPGWEEREHTDGRIFFVDHNHKTTQWEDPRLNKFSGPAVPYNRSYKQKYEYFRSKLREPKETNAKFELKINRKSIFEDSYRQILNVRNTEMLQYKLWIDFIGEKGLDYGGVQREWFFLLSREMFNPYYGLFEYSATDNYTLQINPLSGLANENHLHYFKFIGRVIGMAVYHGRLLDGFFIRPIYKMMLGKKIILQDMESVDLEYYRSLKYLLDNDPADLNLFYSIDEECFGETREIELISDGKNKPVTQENKHKYIECIIHWRFMKRVEHQMNAFLEGFKNVISTDALQIFDANELELLLCGLQDINVVDWKENTIYKGGYNSNHPCIINFWKIMNTFNNELRARFLQFVTGTSRVPMNGFAELWGSNGLHKFTIEKWGTTTQLPRAHTCFNRLDLPPYETFDELRTKLLFAVENTEGFEGVD